jgi:isopentenyl-diphosphate delta-isomerase type 1
VSEEQNEYVVLVDENDIETGKEEKLKAHETGLLHRAFSVFLFRKENDRIQLLLQQREKNKYHCGGLWANTCCSHPRIGESITEAGKRRLKEEMGIDAHLASAGSFQYKAEFDNGLIENERDHVLVGRFDADAGSIPFNPHEVEAVRWVSLPDLEEEYLLYPERFTPWFKPALSLALKHLSHL